MRPRRRLIFAPAAAGVFLLVLAPPASAHELVVVVVAEDVGDARDGFGMGVDESPDVSHPPGEEAGDHLGGIDVDVTYVDAADAAGRAAALGKGPSVVALVGPPDVAAAVRPAIDAAFVVAAAGQPLPAGGRWIVLTDTPRPSARHPEVEARFRARYGRDPSPVALRAYDTAKVLDDAIDSIGESIGAPSSTSYRPRQDLPLVISTVQVSTDSVRGQQRSGAGASAAWVVAAAGASSAVVAATVVRRRRRVRAARHS